MPFNIVGGVPFDALFCDLKTVTSRFWLVESIWHGSPAAAARFGFPEFLRPHHGDAGGGAQLADICHPAGRWRDVLRQDLR